MIETLVQDLRYGVRSLRRSSAFTAAAALTLALGVGANSAIFALVDATLLRPLPFPQPDRLVMLWESSTSSSRGWVAPLNMTDWNARNHTFDRIAGFVPGVGGMVMSGANGIAETVSRQWVTAGFFDVLGVKPLAGRTFLVDDDRRRANAVVLSESFWRSRFNGDPSIVGRDIRLDGAQYTVVGVVPKRGAGARAHEHLGTDGDRRRAAARAIVLRARLHRPDEGGHESRCCRRRHDGRCRHSGA
jgi:putative ABC transport system permease protein